jgi:hypothetical protein
MKYREKQKQVKQKRALKNKEKTLQQIKDFESTLKVLYKKLNRYEREVME